MVCFQLQADADTPDPTKVSIPDTSKSQPPSRLPSGHMGSTNFGKADTVINYYNRNLDNSLISL